MTSRFPRTGIFVFGFVCAAASSAAAPEYSELWGQHGERWPGNGRLPDFSHAGYHRGEQPVPEVPQAANVKDFGAVGDGIADDTRSIQAAIDATRRGAVFVPAGRYKITDYVRITRSGIVLRGAGPDRTVFWFPHGLDEVHPRQGRTSTGSPASGYSFDGGFVSVQGDYQAERLAGIVAVVPRGARHVQVDSAARLAVGQDVLVSVREAPDHSLKTHLYCDDPGDIRRGKKLDTKMVMRILAIEGDRIRFDRPLRFATETAWQPEIRRFAPSVSESGIERIGFAFPGTTYRGHFKENGANAIELRQVTNCWIRDVVIHNGDLGINIVACGNTVDGVLVTADPGRGCADGGVTECTGHHAIQCKRAEDNLITRFEVRASYIHDLSVEHASGNVYAHGRGADVNFDHHKDTPYENLYTDIDCGRGSRVWRCGGGASLGRQCAGWGTFWSIRAARPIAPPPKAWGPVTMNFVGIASSHPAIIEPNGTWWEILGGDGIHPQDLHAAQLERRMSATRRLGKPAAP